MCVCVCVCVCVCLMALLYSAGSCITSEDTVTRDIHYNGHPIQERCTVITRIAPTFIRSTDVSMYNACECTCTCTCVYIHVYLDHCIYNVHVHVYTCMYIVHVQCGISREQNTVHGATKFAKVFTPSFEKISGSMVSREQSIVGSNLT